MNEQDARRRKIIERKDELRKLLELAEAVDDTFTRSMFDVVEEDVWENYAELVQEDYPAKFAEAVTCFVERHFSGLPKTKVKSLRYALEEAFCDWLPEMLPVPQVAVCLDRRLPNMRTHTQSCSSVEEELAALEEAMTPVLRG